MLKAPAALGQERPLSVIGERWARTHRAAALGTALALYAALAFAYWGLPLWGHWTTRVVGSSNDPRDIFVWAMAWWPYALTHGVNPFEVSKVWVPLVTNAGWRTLVPALSLPLAPLTLAVGPVASYNAAMLLAPALTAAAMCLLMYELTGRAWISLWAGAALGSSGYEVSQMLAHLNLTFACLVPLTAWVGLRLYRRPPGRVPWGPVAGLAALLVGQFLISTEILATLTLFSCLGGVLAWLSLPWERVPLRRLAARAALAYGLAGAVLAPWLWAMAHRVPFQHVGSEYAIFSLNALNLVVPTAATVGGIWFQGITRGFADGGVVEASGYLGLPLVALAAWAAARWWSHAAVRVLILLTVGILVLACGPELRVGSWIGPSLPWQLLMGMPVVNALVTGRFMLYVFILVVGLVGWCVAHVDAARTRRWLTVVMLTSLIALLPNLSCQGVWSPAVAPPLLTSPALLGRYVKPNTTVLVMPYFDRGPSTFWQAASGFRFRLADGYLYAGISPTWTLLKLPHLLISQPTPTSRYAAMEFNTLLRLGAVAQVMVALPETVREVALLRLAGLRPEGVVGGVALWAPPPADRRGQSMAPAARFSLALSARARVLRLDSAAVVAACQRYLRSGTGPVTLGRLERAHLLPMRQGREAAPLSGWQETEWGVWLRARKTGAFSVVVRSISRTVFGELVRRFRPDLADAHFIPQARLSSAQPASVTLGAALLQFKSPVGGQ